MKISYEPLWKLLIDKKISQKELWEKAHISSSTCQKLRNNENVTTDVLLRICSILNCNIQEIMEFEKDKRLNVIDLFCGAGGLSEGFKLAGFNIIGGIDFEPNAIKTYNTNFHGARGVCENLMDISIEEIKEKFKDFLNADIIIGGPPCQGFSNANRWKNEMDDDRNKLFFEFVKFVDLIHPKVVVIENVRGIMTANNGYAKKRIYQIFEERGYNVTHKILDASEYGVPQKRMRNFFVMTLDKPFDFKLVKKHDGPFVKEAIGELYGLENTTVRVLGNKPMTNYQKYLTESEKIKYEKGRKGKNVIHYAGKKPWMYEQVNEGTIFWKYAKKSPWYKEICEAQRENIVKREKNERKKRIENALFPEKSVRKEIGRFILSKIYYIKLKRNMG